MHPRKCSGVLLLWIAGWEAHPAIAQNEPHPAELIKAATARPGGRENYPTLPALSTTMQASISGEIVASRSVRNAYQRLGALNKNVHWFEGVKELEKEKAVWCLLSCLAHHSPDVQ